MRQKVYYVRVMGRLPRKRKPDYFEARMSGPDLEEAKRLAKEVVASQKLRFAVASYAMWGISESEFTDSNGEKQTLVMRDIFPSSQSVAVPLE